MPLLLSVSPYIPERQAPYAGHQWYFHFLAAMARQYDVVTLAPGTAENRAAVHAGEVPGEVRLLPGLGHWRSSELQRGALDKVGDELLRGVLHLDTSADDLLAQADVVDVQWPRALPHVREIRERAPGAVLTALEHDVAFTNWSRERLTSLPAPKRLAGYGIGRLVRVRELRLLESCDAFFTFKQSDVDLVGAAGVRTPGYRLSPWLQRPRHRRPAGVAGTDVLFVGAFDRRQNQWGATWLLEKVWPRVRTAAPDARLVLAGGGAPDSLKDAAARADNVVMTGFVDDLADCYEQAGCVVAPVLGGAGLRFKVPQAMLYGVPLVVTPLALEGMEAAPRDCFVTVTDEPGAFADGIVTALRAGQVAERAARVAPEWVDREFSFERSIDVVLDVHARGPRRR